MNKRTKAKRKTRLTDNEVREVAKMQMTIDFYEDALFRMSRFAEGKGDGLILRLGFNGDFWIQRLLKFIESHKETQKND